MTRKTARVDVDDNPPATPTASLSPSMSPSHPTDDRRGPQDAGRSRSLSYRFLEEARAQLRTALPSLASMLLYKVPWMVSLRFVGDIGADELAAAALATTICNVTGLSVSVGLSSALTTLASQSRGDRQRRRQLTMVALSSSPPSTSRNAQKSGTRRAGVRFQNGNDDGDHHNGSASENSRLLPDRDQHTRNERNGTVIGDHQQMPDTPADPLMPLVYLYRGLIVQFVFLLPVGAWWLVGVRPALDYLGQGETLSGLTESYLRILVPGLWSYSVGWTVTSWLQAMEMADVPLYAASAGLALHVPFNYLFIYVWGWGYLGCAAATAAFQILQPVLTLSYLFGTRRGRARVLAAMTAGAEAAAATGTTTAPDADEPGADADATDRRRAADAVPFWPELKAALDARGCLSYLGLAVPGIVIISEWWASEVSIFLAGRLVPYPELALGSLTLYQTINTFCFMFPTAFGVSGSARVGNFLGGCDAEGARFASRVSAACAALVSALMGCVLYWTPHTVFPSLFAPDEDDLVRETSRTVTLLAVYVFADGLQAAFYGTIKGCGRQPVVMPVVVVAYWVVGVPLAYYLAFVKFRGVMCSTSYLCGQVGLVAGMTVGTYVATEGRVIRMGMHRSVSLKLVLLTVSYFVFQLGTHALVGRCRLAAHKLG
jgi:MATE family multidrug resistance protein